MTTVRAVLLLVCVMGLSAVQKTESAPPNADTPLSVEELKLYGDFLDSFVGKDGQLESVSLIEKTVPLILNPGDADGCLKDTGLKISKAADQNSHSFPPSIVKDRALYLVDPKKVDPTDRQAGVLSLSVIGFDDDHRFAVFTFRFLRSGASGLFYERGGTVALRKIDGRWKETNPSCSSWIT